MTYYSLLIQLKTYSLFSMKEISERNAS